MIAQTQPTVKTLTIGSLTLPIAAWQRSHERSVAKGIKVFQCNGHWFASAVSQPGHLHHENGACDCEGATYGRLCRHVAAVVSQRIR